MYILILDFQLGGGGKEMFIYILDKSCKALSVLLGGLWEEKNCFCTSSTKCVRDNVTTHPSLRLYKPQSCFLESDPMIIASC